MTVNPDNKSLDMNHHIVNVLKKIVCVKIYFMPGKIM